MTGIMKAQIDWIPLVSALSDPLKENARRHGSLGRISVLQRGKSIADSGSLDAHDYDPNQSSVAKAFLEFDDAGRMKPSAYYERVVDVMEELVKFTLLTRDVASVSGRSI